MKRTDILNLLVRRRSYRDYLEIGVRNPKRNHDRVRVERKQGVDPNGNCTHPVTSDEFFAHCQDTFDLIFIDGLHTDDQVERDIANSLRVLRPGGCVVLHDCNPPTAEHQTEEYNDGAWLGTVWKAVVRFRARNHESHDTFVVDCDWGVGVVAPRENGLFEFARQIPRHEFDTSAELEFDFLERHREALLGLVKPSEFREALRWKGFSLSRVVDLIPRPGRD
ncbi:MAG: class I SAM-dependent methyltransferase [Planctomycetota bacterium]|jgi:SAM-dependent methyltransferase